MKKTALKGVAGLLILLFVIVSIGLIGVSRGFDSNVLLADETSGDDGSGDEGPSDFA